MEYTAINRAIQKEILKVLKKISVDHGLDYETLVSEHLVAPVSPPKKMEAECKKVEKAVKKAEVVPNKKKSKIMAVKKWGKLGNYTKLWMWVAECGYIEE